MLAVKKRIIEETYKYEVEELLAVKHHNAHDYLNSLICRLECIRDSVSFDAQVHELTRNGRLYSLRFRSFTDA